MNEFYSCDISCKLKSSYRLRAKQGRYTGCVPPFGYLKDPDQKGHLIIDEETAWIVRKMFDYAMENRGSGYIVRRLEEEKHDPIVDRSTFELVQGKSKQRQHPQKNKEFSLFSGLIKCGECGKALVCSHTHEKNPQNVYCCKTYNRFGAHHCTQHRVAYDVLYQLVLDRIRSLAKAALSDDEAVLDQVARIAEERGKDLSEDKSHSIAKLEDRLKALERLVAKLYEDYIAGRVSSDNFDSVLQRTQKEQEAVRRQMEALKAEDAPEQEQRMSLQEWKELIRGYANIQELDRESLNRLVRSIIVHETVDGRKRHLKIEIHFNFREVTEMAEAGAFASPAAPYRAVMEKNRAAQ